MADLMGSLGFIKRLALFSMLYGLPSSAFSAGQSAAVNTDITKISVYAGDLVFISTTQPSASTVSNCDGENYTGEWSISLATESGRALYALVLSAAAQRKKVSVYGGSVGCSLIDNRETIIRADINL